MVVVVVGWLVGCGWVVGWCVVVGSLWSVGRSHQGCLDTAA